MFCYRQVKPCCVENFIAAGSCWGCPPGICVWVSILKLKCVVCGINCAPLERQRALAPQMMTKKQTVGSAPPQHHCHLCVGEGLGIRFRGHKADFERIS